MPGTQLWWRSLHHHPLFLVSNTITQTPAPSSPVGIPGYSQQTPSLPRYSAVEGSRPRLGRLSRSMLCMLTSGQGEEHQEACSVRKEHFIARDYRPGAPAKTFPLHWNRYPRIRQQHLQSTQIGIPELTMQPTFLISTVLNRCLFFLFFFFLRWHVPIKWEKKSNNNVIPNIELGDYLWSVIQPLDVLMCHWDMTVPSENKVKKTTIQGEWKLMGL